MNHGNGNNKTNKRNGTYKARRKQDRKHLQTLTPDELLSRALIRGDQYGALDIVRRNQKKIDGKLHECDLLGFLTISNEYFGYDAYREPCIPITQILSRLSPSSNFAKMITPDQLKQLFQVSPDFYETKNNTRNVKFGLKYIELTDAGFTYFGSRVPYRYYKYPQHKDKILQLLDNGVSRVQLQNDIPFIYQLWKEFDKIKKQVKLVLTPILLADLVLLIHLFIF